MALRVIVVGGGLSGMACAGSLARRGSDVTLIEASDRLGGRLRSDVVDGFTLDRGFQVLFTAYPHVSEAYGRARTKARPFGQGAEIWYGPRPNERDVISQSQIGSTILSKAMTLADKIRLLIYSVRLNAKSPAGPSNLSANEYLRVMGFSRRSIDRFFRPFFGGVFLDRELGVSARQFEFVFAMLARGRAVTFEGGIQTFARAVAEGLGSTTVELNTRVESIGSHSVTLADGRRLEADAIVLASDARTAARLLGETQEIHFQTSVTIHFDAPKAETPTTLLWLNGSGCGRVNHVAAMSDVCPSLAPAGRRLMCATILGSSPETDDEVIAIAKSELGSWFRTGVESWRALRVDRIELGQLPQRPGFELDRPDVRTKLPGVYLAGEATTNSSIDGAIEAGLKAAEAIRADKLSA